MNYREFKYSVAKFLISHDFTRKYRVKRFLRDHPVVKLQLGCGSNRLPGWLNTDMNVYTVRAGAEYLDVSKKFWLPDCSVDYVFSEHLFEHLTYPQAGHMLSECHRVLKPGGVIRIATPNLAFLADLYLHPDSGINRQYIEWAAKQGGIPATPTYVLNRFHTAWGHQIVYDHDTLVGLLSQYGFRDIRRCEMSKSAHEALSGVEGHFRVMPYDFCCLETMILEARK